MDRPVFKPLKAFEKGEKTTTTTGTGKGLEYLAQHISCQIKPLKEKIHYNFLKGDPTKPYITASDLKLFFRDQVVSHGMDVEEDYRVLGLVRGGPRAAIIHPFSVAFHTQTLNGTDEEIVVSFMHDGMEDYPETLDEFVEYYTTGTLHGNFTIPPFALDDIKTLTNREGFIAKRLDKRLQEQFTKKYRISSKHTNRDIKIFKDHFYTRDRVNGELNTMTEQVRSTEPLNGDIANSVRVIQELINERMDRGFTPYDAITDVNRTSVTYDLYIDRIKDQLPPNQRGRKMDDRIDNIGDDKHMKDKHKLRSLYKAYKIIEVMNRDEFFMTLSADDLFRLNTLKERFIHRINDRDYINLKKVRRSKQETYKGLITKMRSNLSFLIEEVNDYKNHPEAKEFIGNLTPYTPSHHEISYHPIRLNHGGPAK